MKKKILKIAMWVGIVLVLILTFLFFLGLYGQRIENYFINKNQEKMMVEIEKQKAEILEAQKNDTYGGQTPEETLDMYIEALKAGDIELASKYYEISLERSKIQYQELEDLKNVIKRDGNLDLVIEEIEKIRKFGKKNIWSDIQVSFVFNFVTREEIKDVSVFSQQEITTIIPAGTSLDVGKSLRLNPYTKVWKIIQ